MNNENLTQLCAAYKQIKAERRLARATYRGFKHAARIARARIKRERRLLRDARKQAQTEQLLDSMLNQLRKEAAESRQAAQRLSMQGLKVR